MLTMLEKKGVETLLFLFPFRSVPDQKPLLYSYILLLIAVSDFFAILYSLKG
jgi:hypothetical protein